MSLFSSNLMQNFPHYLASKINLPLPSQPALPNPTNFSSQFTPSFSLSKTIHNPINPQQKIICHKIDDNDPDLVMFEPVKKVKVDNLTSKTVEPIRGHGNSKSHTTKLTHVSLTLDQVFNTSGNNKGNSEDNDDKLSFITCSSDSLELLEEDEDDCMIIEPPIKPVKNVNMNKNVNFNVPVLEPLAIKDSLFQSPYLFNQFNLTNFNTTPAFRNPITPLNAVGFELQKRLQALNELQAAKPSFLLNSLGSFSSSNEYNKSKETTADVSDQDAVKLEDEKPLNNKVYNEWNLKANNLLNEFDQDIDSNSTGSTGLGLDSRNSSAMESIMEKTQKSISSFCNFATDVFQDQTMQPVKRGRGRPKKGEKVEKQQKPTVKLAKNPKKQTQTLIEYNSLNMTINNNKGVRGLNRLQLLKYQEAIPEMEEEDAIKRASIIDFDSTSQEEQKPRKKYNNQSIKEYTISDEAQIDIPIGEEHQITIQPFVPNSNPPQRRRTPLVVVWNPEKEDQEMLKGYLEELGKVIEAPVTNQEKAIKLLKSFNMNIAAVLEVVKEDVPLYKELFKVKWNRFRGCRLGYQPTF